jgi:hypothetical protein
MVSWYMGVDDEFPQETIERLSGYFRRVLLIFWERSSLGSPGHLVV